VNGDVSTLDRPMQAVLDRLHEELSGERVVRTSVRQYLDDWFDAKKAETATRKNNQLAAAQWVALKMGRRPRCSSVTYRFRYAPSYCQSGSDRPAEVGPAAHFERNDVTIICETVH
jgi:hypothetical protein